MHAGVVQLVSQLSGAVGGVDGGYGGARFQDAEIGGDELGAVGDKETDSVPLLHAKTREGGGEPVALVVKLCEGEGAVTVDDGGFVGEAGGGALENLEERVGFVRGEGGAEGGGHGWLLVGLSRGVS